MESEVLQRLSELERRVGNIIRHGTIVEADYETARVKVDIGEGHITGWLKWYTTRANGNEVTWAAPEVGERVTVLSEGGDPHDGRVLAAVYCDDNPAPSVNPEITAVQHKDLGHVTYDRESGHYTIQPHEDGMIKLLVGGSEIRVKNGSVRVEADHVNVLAETVHADANAITLEAGAVNLGGEGGKAVARVGDQVNLLTGKIMEGSSVVKAK